MASDLILEWGRRGEARMAESGVWGFWGGGSHHQMEVCGSAVSSPPSGIQGRAPVTKGFSCILCRQIAFPSISVHVAYSLHGYRY